MAALSVALLGLCLSVPVLAQAGNEAPLAPVAQRPAATTPEWLVRLPVSETRHALPRLGLVVTEVRKVQPDGRISRQVVLSEGSLQSARDQTGLVLDAGDLDLDVLRQREHALGLQARGGMDEALHAAVASLGEEERLDVVFWLHEPQDGRDLGAQLRQDVRGLPRAEIAAAVRAARRDAHAAARARFLTGNTALAAEVERVGARLLQQADVWPFVIASVSAGQARELAAHDLVDEAYLCQPEWFEEGDNAQGTFRTPTVWAQGVFADGSVKVMVNDTAQVQLNNQFLPTVTALNTGFTGAHATGVAGNIANTHPVYKAAAHTLPELFTADGNGDVEAPPIWSNAVQQGIDFGNCSWWNGQKGSIQFLDRFFDHTIRTFGVMLFKSTGNQGQTGSPYSTTPGNGYNMISSGAYTDQENVTWEGDDMSSTSSYWDPVEGHEKPEVASPGTCVETTGTGLSGLQSCFGGTSSASPLTCSVAALISSADNTLLSQMTTVKAVLMASAWHNVEGDDVLSEKDGAGGVHAAAAYAVVRDQQWWYDDVEAGDFPGGVLDIPVTLRSGEETRIVALWFSNANSAYTTDVLDMDLDMAILDPNDNVVASSANAFNPFEIVGFQTPKRGEYTIRLTRQRFDGTSEPLTVAWSTKADTATARFGLADGSPPFAIGNTVEFALEEPYEGPGNTYIAWASLKPPTGAAMIDGYAWPIGVDIITKWTVNLPGFTGALDGVGESSTFLSLPGNPNIVDIAMHFAMVVLGPTAQLDDVYTISDQNTFVVGN